MIVSSMCIFLRLAECYDVVGITNYPETSLYGQSIELQKHNIREYWRYGQALRKSSYRILVKFLVVLVFCRRF